MKKYSWIVALLLALTLAFFGCPSPGDDDDDDDDDNEVVMEWKTVWEMAEDEVIQAIDEGPMTFPAGSNLTDSPFYPLIRAGDDTHVTIEAVKVDGKTSFKFTTIANWGAGIDLRYSLFSFMVGDKITITGELLSAGAAQANFRIGAEDSHGFKVSAPGPFNWEIELTAALLREIQTGNPAGLRIDGRPDGVTVRIDNIKIEGTRVTSKLAAPVITATANGVQWAEVTGANAYEVYADGDLLDTVSTTSINLNAQESLEVDTVYSITVVAIVSAGDSLNSNPSNAIQYTHKLPSIPTIYQVPESGDNFFYVNLNDWETAGTDSINATVPDGVLAADKITLTFSANDQRVNFKLTEAQKTLLASAGSLKITIEGTAEPDTNFRYHIGDALAGSSWNATNSFDAAAFSTIAPEKDITFSSTKNNTTLGYFILQQRAAASTAVEIASIKIEIVMTPISILEIPGVTAPVLAETPVTAITDTAQYTGTVAWKDADGTALDGAFGPSTVYTATITLTAKPGFTFAGVEEDGFTVAGATATYAAGSNVVTAVFPETADHLIPLSGAIGGVTAPVALAAPVTAVTATDQYTGTVAWTYGEGTALTGNFAYSTVYTATITLTPKPGYTITGIIQDSFTVAGATATNSASSGTVTAVFPATAGPPAINIAAIPGVAVPVPGVAPVTSITETAQYTGTVAWTYGEGTALTGNFAYSTVYTATITLTAKSGFTLTGVSANYFTVEGATSVTNAANSGTVTAVFPATAPEGTTTPITISAITGLTAPVAGATPVTAITPTAQYTGTVAWTYGEGTALTGNFDYDTAYTATVTLTPVGTYSLAGLAANFFTVDGAESAIFNQTAGTITVVFEETEAAAAGPYEDIAPTLSSNDGAGTTQGTWSGTVTGNSATWTGGAVRYAFPSNGPGFNIADYDFFEIEYTGGAGAVILKQFNTGADYMPIGGSQYPTLAADGGTFKFEIRGAGTTGGIAFQANTGSGTGERTITVTKVTFTQGTRYTVALNPAGGTLTQTSMVVVLDTKVGSLPTPERLDHNFAGWKLGTTDVTADTVVTTSFLNATLIAQWTEKVAVTEKIIDFTTAAARGNATLVSKTETTLEFKNSYGGGIVVFTVDIGEASLGDYDTITFTFSNTTQYKTLYLIGATALGNSAQQDPANKITTAPYESGDTARTNVPVTLTIASSAGALTGVIELAFTVWDNSDTYTITNFKLNPAP